MYEPVRQEGVKVASWANGPPKQESAEVMMAGGP